MRLISRGCYSKIIVTLLTSQLSMLSIIFYSIGKYFLLFTNNNIPIFLTLSSFILPRAKVPITPIKKIIYFFLLYKDPYPNFVIISFLYRNYAYSVVLRHHPLFTFDFVSYLINQTRFSKFRYLCYPSLLSSSPKTI